VNSAELISRPQHFHFCSLQNPCGQIQHGNAVFFKQLQHGLVISGHRISF